MNTEQIRFTETNSADDSKGRTWGLDGNLFWFVAGGAFCAVAVLLVCFSALRMSMLVSILFAGIPLTVAMIYVLAFKQGKPPGYDIDCLDLWLNGRGFEPAAHQRSKNPLYVCETSKRSLR